MFIKTDGGEFINDRFIIRLRRDIWGGWLCEVSGVEYEDGSGLKSYRLSRAEVRRLVGGADPCE